MDQAQVIALLEEDEAILKKGHFRLTSGRHSDTYIEKAQITPHPSHVEDLCFEIAEQFQGKNVQAVVSPAVGAIPLGYEVSRVMTELTGREVLNFYAEKARRESDGAEILVLGRGYYNSIAGMRVLLVDDLLTTGGSIQRLKDSLPPDATVVGVAVLANRGGITAESLGVPELVALATLDDIVSYAPSDCPMCKEGIPINQEHGHGGQAS